MKRLIAILLLIPALAFANDRHPKPQPKPETAKPRCSCWWQDALPVVGLLGVTGFVIYSQKDDKGSKKVAIVPAEGGAKLAGEIRF